ncbi:MAG: J domain-containing protein [Alphaproteobacteria bacterium]|jgi:hypothetical protein|nr:J domain-containing protein [Alphaproteobacteria bacterium]
MAQTKKIEVNLKYFILNDPKSNDSEKLCDFPGCHGIGKFKAPQSKQTLQQYYWFCMPHIRDYNAKWDYYAGMNMNQIEAHLKEDAVLQKPTWPFGSHGKLNPSDYNHDPIMIKLPENIKQSLIVLNLHFPFALDKLRQTYKDLVKKYHPDLMGATDENIEKLKQVNNAYALLRDYLVQQGKTRQS